MTQTAKILLAENQILSNPNAESGKVLLPATAEMVKQFYVPDEISKIT
jgi:hypothetical protein